MEAEEHTVIESAEELQEKIEFHRALACRIKLEPSEMMIADDVQAFLCQELIKPAAEIIFKHLKDLEVIIKRTFRGIISVSLELLVDPEAMDGKGIRVNLLLKESPEEAFRQYDEYIEALIKQFPFDFSKWFFTSLHFV
jgi:hypothetical protein